MCVYVCVFQCVCVSAAYLNNLRAIDLLQLGEAVVDALRVGSPLQQVQHVTCRGWRDIEPDRGGEEKERERERDLFCVYFVLFNPSQSQV